MAQLLIIPGILCLGYYLFLQVLRMDFCAVWLAAGVLLTGLGIWNRWLALHQSHMPALWKGLLLAAAAVCIAVFLLLEAMIVSGMASRGRPDLDYVIVLGAQVRGNVPSRSLWKRIRRAQEYLEENPRTVAVLSGGQGRGELVSEAECMRRELEKMGIPRERLILEDRSSSTEENLDFSARLAPVKEGRTGLITQNFHVFRSVRLARKQGYRHVWGIASPAELLYQPHFMVREAFALVKEKLAGNI